MRDTPRTDAIAHRGYHLDALAARAIDLCRELERENAALRSALDYQANYQRDLRADRDRLDWIIGKAHYLFFKELGSDLAKGREQIDAAREAQP
jgi:hypothetical protein